MKLFEPLRLKFEHSNWAKSPEFGLIDTILEEHPGLFKLAEGDILKGSKESEFGRRDMPSVEQIIRAAIFKEMRGLDYRELEFQQEDSRICEQFLKIEHLRPFSASVLQKYISKIKGESLQQLLVELNRIAIGEGLEDIKKLRQDATVIETNIHHPTNNSLMWDCIRESHRLLSQLAKEVEDVQYRDYLRAAKKTYYKINNTKSGDKQVDLFRKQLVTFTKCINQVSNIVKKNPGSQPSAISLRGALEKLLPLMRQVYRMTELREIQGMSVPSNEKLFSIYEQHTDIIVKGAGDVKFGHKVNLSSGASNLILSCEITEGNPKDSTLYQPTIKKIIETYGITPKSSATDGGYASKANAEYASTAGIVNIVFNKIVGSLKNIVSSKNMETRLKKWRSGIEANISNLKRGFGISRCNWSGEAGFRAKVLWSVIAYNIRVMTAAMLSRM